MISLCPLSKVRVWTKEIFHSCISFVDSKKLQEEMQQYSNISSDSLKLKYYYPTFKKIAGVNIETGSIFVYRSSLLECLELLNNFVKIRGSFRAPIYDALQNFEALTHWTKSQSLEVPNYDLCKGYILNQELVRFDILNEPTSLQFKYKDHIDDTYILYQLCFLLARNEYFILRRKTF